MRQFLLTTMTAVLLTGGALGQDWAVEKLEKSPRHHEWVALEQGDRELHSFVVFPEVDMKVPAVLLIHENRGLTDWVRSLADDMAAAGYIAIAPDLLSGSGPDGGKTSDFPSSDAAREAIYQLDSDQVTSDLHAAFDYASKLEACNGQVAVGGFCWGGSQTFRYATNQPNLIAAFVFYGTAPKDSAAFAAISCPVYGFYGENDARVNATIDDTKAAMKAAGKVYEPEIYAGARHAFMRRGDSPDADAIHKKARDEAWSRWMSLLQELSQVSSQPER